MNPRGLGFFVWLLDRLGEPGAVAAWLARSGVQWIAVKVSDGPAPVTGRARFGTDLTPNFIHALKGAGIGVHGWSAVHGARPVDEARAAYEAAERYDLESVIFYVEDDMLGRDAAAAVQVAEFRGLTSAPLGLCAPRYPVLRPTLPWKFYTADYFMPQLFWEGASAPGVQLHRSVMEYKNLYGHEAEIIPVGAAYSWNNWSPTPAGQLEFMETARAIGLPGVAWWELFYARQNPAWWEAITTKL